MKKAVSLMLALLMVLSVVCLMQPAAYAASHEELAALQEKKEELQGQINEVRSNKKRTLEKKYLMDQRNAVLQQEIDLVAQQIQDTTERIAANEAQEKEQYELFCRQVRQEEERGSVSYWSVLFKATSFADLLSRADFINEVAAYDADVISELQTLREQLAEDKTSLEADKAELNAAQSELQQQIAEADQLLEEYTASEKGLQDMYDEEERAAKQMEAELRELARQRELERQRQNNSNSNSNNNSNNNSSSTVPNSNGYIWPTNNTRLITSPIGGRASPGGIGSTNHQGVDIGAGYGTDILAAKAGVVVQSGWYGGYGYCVTIQHGNNAGTYTRYGHMSRILVSTGQTVSQGQVIGKCGSTGNSTGPHIHFEIHENGVLKNPLDYLSGWVRGNW